MHGGLLATQITTLAATAVLAKNGCMPDNIRTRSAMQHELLHTMQLTKVLIGSVKEAAL